MVEKKLIHFNSDSDYQNQKDTINSHSIVFIKDSRKIVTHGKEYHAQNWSILEPIVKTVNKGTITTTGSSDIKVYITFEKPVASDLRYRVKTTSTSATFTITKGSTSANSVVYLSGTLQSVTLEPTEDDTYIYELVY